MNAYVCDCCEKTIVNPHKMNMKEFFVGREYDFGMMFPVKSTRRIKIHICDECYRGLRKIAEKKLEEK